jgi:hypothetical protein
MSQLQWQEDLAQWSVQGMWIAAVLLSIIYIPNFNWRQSLPGRGFCILILAIVGALFRNVLVIWGVITITLVAGKEEYGLWDEIFTWLSIVSIAAAGIAIILLLFHTAKELWTDEGHPFSKLRGRHRRNPDDRLPTGKP